MNPSRISNRLVEEWCDEIETWLPDRINGICSPSQESITRYKYVPSSARIDNIDINNDEFPGKTKVTLLVAYQIERSEMVDGNFMIDQLHGAVFIPIEENHQLRLEGINPLNGILELMESGYA